MFINFNDKHIESLSEDETIRKVVAEENHKLVLLRSGAVVKAGRNKLCQGDFSSSRHDRHVTARIQVD